MSDLTEFLLARLAEDEAGARAAATYSAEWSTSDEFNETVVLAAGDKFGHTFDSVYGQIAPHIARHDPARVLAEVEAKRRIVEEHPDYGGYGTSCATCQSEDDLVGDPWPCVTLRHLATVYNDHDDFQEAWRV